MTSILQIPKKLLKRIVRLIYSTERRSSEEQLRSDFDVFPPFPLSSAKTFGEFDVVRIRSKTGIVIYEMKFIASIYQGIQSDPQFLSAEMSQFEIAESFQAMRDATNEFGPRQKWFFVPILALIAGFVVVGFYLPMFIIRRIIDENNRPGSFGRFYPFRRVESSILINTALLSQCKRDEAPIISHEHIHLLQNNDPHNYSLKADSTESFLNKKFIPISPRLTYLLQKNEIEARLHEMLICFYQTHKYIPVTMPDFLGMLAANDVLGNVVTMTLKRLEFDSNTDIEQYAERDKQSSDELLYVLCELIYPDITDRFVTEVLPVMYANLLRLYGDQKASQAFLNEVGKNNLFDELYEPRRFNAKSANAAAQATS